jgi:ATP-dependent RNA helicase DeaD
MVLKMEQTTFASLGLVKTLASIEKKGFEEPTPVQAKTIPLLLSGSCDVAAQAQTGTGKTAAFALPLIESLSPRAGHVQALILAPTRELALQVCDEFKSLAPDSGLSIAAVYGGQSMVEQLRRLDRGVDIVVGTPGRVMDHMRRGSLNLGKVSFLILDEADEMLDQGFIEDIEFVLKSVNPERRMLLFSATLSGRIMQVANTYMKNMQVVRTVSDEIATKLTDQIYIEVDESDRFEALCRVVDMAEDFYGLVFCRTKVDCDNVTHKLNSRGYGVDALHGDITQSQREKILGKMKGRVINILVATDVAARGIDISGLSHVINYSLPQNPEAYIHRIGRTGRAGSEGTAITFVSPYEYRKLNFIKRIAGTEIRREELPEIDDIIGAKKDRLKSQVETAIASKAHIAYLEDAKAVATTVSTIDALAAVLSIAFAEHFDTARYGKIMKKERRPRNDSYRDRDGGRDSGRFERKPRGEFVPSSKYSDRPVRAEKSFSEPVKSADAEKSADKPAKKPLSGVRRIIMNAGKDQGMTPHKLSKTIKSAVDIDDSRIGAISVEDTRTFVSLPAKEAEQLVATAFTESPSAPVFEFVQDRPKPAAKSFEKKPYEKKPYGEKTYAKKSFEKKPYGEKAYAKKSFEKKPYGEKTYAKKSFDKKPFGKKPYEKKGDAAKAPKKEK